MKETLFLIDGSSLIYRAFHAIPLSFTNSKGLPTNAVYGFTQSLRKIIGDFSPHYIGIAFDIKGPSFRHEMYESYKAERPPMPGPLVIQMPYIKKMVRAYNIPVLEKESFEADDVIATLVKRFGGAGLKIAVITGDKDMYQLVDGDTVILDYLTGSESGEKEVVEKFGVPAERIRDLLGLAGDSSDNIPGVPGIGLKTAAKLLQEYGTLEAVLGNVDNIQKQKLKENLGAFRDQAVLSKELATLHPDVPLECALEDLRYSGPDYKALEALLSELEFKKILKEIAPLIPHEKEEGADYRIIDDEERLASVAEEIKGAGRLSLMLTLSEEGYRGSLEAATIGISPKKAFYIPVKREEEQAGVGEAAFLDVLKGLLENDKIRKDTDDSKSLYLYFAKGGVDVKGVSLDTSIASYLLNPSKPDHSIEAVAYEFSGYAVKEKAEGLEAVSSLKCKMACTIVELASMLEDKLREDGLYGLYVEMELPLSRVLSGMESHGVLLNKDLLSGLSKELELELKRIEAAIYGLAGTEFNISSPKQLSEVLFDRLKLKPLKKTKTGFSTDEEVLTQLAARHEVPQQIMNFRQLAKLKSTYVDALLELIDPSTGRVHTSFNQTVTATGRLSSSRPNLQNIPVRGESGARIREAFMARPGHTLFSADYSQIELRIVAHMSGDPVLIDAFEKGEDIHTRTASEVFGILPALVTGEMRRRAKAINFGIIYGMGPFGLSTELGISMKEALEYINSYFEHYGSVKRFIDRTIDEAAEKGYTVTLFGRRRYIPELKSPVEQVSRLGARLAINTPIQGSAADMIKAAMITIDSRLKARGLTSKMILQVHDELVFETAAGELKEVSEIVKKEMEGVVSLKVPVVVKTKSGSNLREVE